jgi:hypothetical protein
MASWQLRRNFVDNRSGNVGVRGHIVDQPLNISRKLRGPKLFYCLYDIRKLTVNRVTAFFGIRQTYCHNGFSIN